MELRQPTVALSAWIPEQIAAYATDPTSYMERIAARNGVLPLYLGLGMDFGLRPDGSLARFEEGGEEADWELSMRLGYDDPLMDLQAVAFGAERHP